MIISNDKYQMTEINSSAYSVQMRLVIRNIQRSDLGGYKCISKNSIGDAEGNIRLYGKSSTKAACCLCIVNGTLYSKKRSQTIQYGRTSRVAESCFKDSWTIVYRILFYSPV